MFTIGGLVFLLLCVFGSFIASGGAIGPLIASMPFELLSILGAAVGSFLMANSIQEIKHTVAGFKKTVKGPAYKKTDYVEMLSLLYFFVRLASAKGATAIEPHIESPESSSAFIAFPKVLANRHASSMICDYLRMVGMNADDPHQIDDIMARELKKTLAEELHPCHALQSMSDALPALGIVAAVLGVIKTMSKISEPPAVLGEMIGGALVGTFLGVLLAYGVVAPIAAKLRSVVIEESKYYELIRAVIVAHLHGNPPQISIESGRKMVPTQHMPTFQELEIVVQNLQII
ncbi:flagellar motor stator protein MotA [Lichenicola cladoniae]|uniref:Flagellar motor stator protein MotA n=1 Tax=Lichenicola cladoniae TaxID=1484109 RepID=A0A6M8HU08_9PROT|nr:flagellar motor stator protein MotA [Lichenicola cladoniae]NPD67550.1 flagellar motor stator protein MotA [Acetobacteraceae bacterium]QKE91800.1 flagellar motor stator protein MotA [Lichenicola cladoniae]